MRHKWNSLIKREGITIMKLFRHSLLVFLLIMACLCPGCAAKDKTSIRNVLKTDLDRLKSMDSDLAGEYLQNASLFPDTDPEGAASEEIKDVFSLYFKDFSYKIGSINVQGDDAAASVTITTPDSRAIARDYASEELELEIKGASASSDASLSSGQKSDPRLLLNHILKTGAYEIVKSDISIPLTREGEAWSVKKSSALENDLTGGLVTALHDPEILSPSDTLEIYLSAIKTMDTDTLERFLGIQALSDEKAVSNETASDEPDSDESGSVETDTRSLIAKALTEQVQQHFSYEIKDEKRDGYRAEVSADITSFDSSAILSAYQEAADAYLASADALIDGYDRRREKLRQYLLKAITENTAAATAAQVFHFTNDGLSWKPDDPETEFGTALLVDFASSGEELLSQDEEE